MFNALKKIIKHNYNSNNNNNDNNISNQLNQVNAVPQLPDEMLLTIFSFLNKNELIPIPRVCKHWSLLFNNNLLWKNIAEKELPKTSLYALQENSLTDSYYKQYFQYQTKIQNDRLNNILKKVKALKNLTEKEKKLFTKPEVQAIIKHHYIGLSDILAFTKNRDIASAKSTLSIILSPPGIQALKTEKITAKEATIMSAEELIQKLEDLQIIEVTKQPDKGIFHRFKKS